MVMRFITKDKLITEHPSSATMGLCANKTILMGVCLLAYHQTFGSK
jgi:hypothetical protein